MRFAARSDIGKVRKVNEDSFYIPELDDKVKLFLIADGIGGQNHGKLAGMMTVESVVRSIYKDSDNSDKKSISQITTEQATTQKYNDATNIDNITNNILKKA